VTGLRFLSKRWLARTRSTAVVNCGRAVTAVHAGLLTYIYIRNDLREIPNARLSPIVPAFTTSENVSHVHHVRFGSESISLSDSGFLPAPMRGIMDCNDANVWLLPAVQHASTRSRNPNRLSKRRSLVNCDLRAQVHRQLTPVLWEKREGMCKLLPRTMQDFALTISRAFSRVVLVRTKCFRKFGGVGSHWPLLAPTSGP
jgi:hypothetical protein